MIKWDFTVVSKQVTDLLNYLNQLLILRRILPLKDECAKDSISRYNMPTITAVQIVNAIISI